MIGVPAEELEGPEFAADRVRYVVMGSSVCITAAFSFFALTAALTIATGGFSPIYLLFGLIWSLFVFTLDRWVVSVVHHGTGWRHHAREAALACCRLAIAVLIGLSISIPIEMLLFRAEVGVEVDRMRAEEVDRTITAIRDDDSFKPEKAVEAQRLAVANDAVTRAREKVAAADKAYDDELSGRLGTGKPGDGRRSRQRADDLEAAKEELATATDAAATARSRYDARVSEIERARVAAENRARDEAERRSTGLIDRVKALHSLAQDEVVGLFQWVVRGLVLLVDVSPVLLKMASPRTIWDDMRPARVESTRRRMSERIRADEHVDRVRILAKRNTDVTGIHAKALVATEKVELDADIRRRGNRKRHDAEIRRRNLAAPRHRLLSAPRRGDGLGADRRLSIVPSPDSTRPARHRAR